MVLHTGAVDRNERERRTIAREWVRQGRGGKKGLDRSHAWNVPLFCGDRHARQGRLTRCGGAIRLLGGHRLQDAPTQHHTDDQAPAAVLMGPPAASDSRAFRHPQSPHIQKLRAVQYCRGAHCAEHGASPRRLATSTHTPTSAVRQQVQPSGETHPPRTGDPRDLTPDWPNTRNTVTMHRDRSREAADLTKKSARSSPAVLPGSLTHD